MERDAQQVRAEALATALSPQVGGPHGIQNAGWWKIALSFALIVAAIMGVYHLVMPRTYAGRLAWEGQGTDRRLRLVDAGVLLDYNDASVNVEVDGSTAMLPEESLPAYFSTSKVVVHWLPYWSQMARRQRRHLRDRRHELIPATPRTVQRVADELRRGASG